MLMDAIIKPAREKGLELVRKEIPQIGFGEALVKIHYTAICGTDVHIYDWNDWAQKTIKTPMTIGVLSLYHRSVPLLFSTSVL